MSKQIAPYGSWASPITSKALIAATKGLSELQADGQDLYWLENRPEEKGRNAIVCWRQGKVMDILPTPLNARSKVNEYGGGSYCIDKGIVYFVLFDDQCIYRLDTQSPQAIPEAITQASTCRYGDLYFDHHHNRLLAVCEDHGEPDAEAATSLVYFDLNAEQPISPITIQAGADFYASASVSTDGSQLTWLEWNHPNMPWDGTWCFVADLDTDGAILNKSQVAGGEDESIVQPQFSPNGDLLFVSDRGNWWNLYRRSRKGNSPPICLLEMPAEFAGPQWVGGLSWYRFIDSDTVIGCYSQGGTWHLYRLQIDSGEFTSLPTPCTEIAYLSAKEGKAYFIGGFSNDFDGIYALDGDHVNCITQPSRNPFAQEDIAKAEAIEFPLTTRSGTSHAFYYPPTNAKFAAPASSLPPLIVFCHGGPTSATHGSLNLKIQFWTSRGFAVADVNYGGSTGFGRDYRRALVGQWGVVDVQDCIDCVSYLVQQNLANPDQLAIRGGSAGGYTVLCALTFHQLFKAGASHYGVGDLETLATDTHKFESRYLDSLVGPYPEQRPLYQQRSPIHHVDQLACPVIFFQGLQDKIVPPNQAEAMVAALDSKGIPHALVTFEEEGHGFRQAANQRRALEAEYYFYAQVFGFSPAEEITPVDIKHLK